MPDLAVIKLSADVLDACPKLLALTKLSRRPGGSKTASSLSPAALCITLRALVKDPALHPYRPRENSSSRQPPTALAVILRRSTRRASNTGGRTGSRVPTATAEEQDTQLQAHWLCSASSSSRRSMPVRHCKCLAGKSMYRRSRFVSRDMMLLHGANLQQGNQQGNQRQSAALLG